MPNDDLPRDCWKPAALGLCAATFAVLAPAQSWAHGSMEVPISRVYRCFNEGPEAPKTAACRAVVAAGGTQPLYDWTEVNQFEANGHHKAIIADGKLCAGGRDKYVGLDLTRRDWKTTKIAPDASGKFKFVFYATTPHATRYFRIYVTRDGWKPTDGLTWDNIQLLKTVNAPEARDNRYSMKVKLPKGKTGRHVVYAIWQRSDSMEAFYSCSDVEIMARGAAAAAEPGWNEAGRAIARNELPPGSTVSFRVFDPAGGDVERHVVKIAAGESPAPQWPAALARKVNAESDIFRIGVLDSSASGLSVQPIASATDNRVYLSDAYEGYTYTIDVDTP